MENYEAEKMNEKELDSVAGGQTYWYLRITGTWTDPATGKMFKDGYLVRGKNIHSGKCTASFWIASSEWQNFKELEEYRGNEFVMGDTNPDGVDNPKAVEK